MPADFLEVCKIFGAGGAAFLCFYLYHRSTAKQFDSILEEQSKQSANMFQILKSMIEQNNLQLAYLQEIKTLVSANLWCPYVKRAAGLTAEEQK